MCIIHIHQASDSALANERHHTGLARDISSPFESGAATTCTCEQQPAAGALQTHKRTMHTEVYHACCYRHLQKSHLDNQQVRCALSTRSPVLVAHPRPIDTTVIAVTQTRLDRACV